MTRLAPDFGGGGGGLPRFLVGGAVISGLVSAARQVRGALERRRARLDRARARRRRVFAGVAWIIVQARPSPTAARS